MTAFIKAWTSDKQPAMHSALDPAVDRYMQLDEEDQADFRALLRSYIKLYQLEAQVMPFQDAELESLYLYGRMLANKLPREMRGSGFELEGDVDLEYYRLKKVFEGSLEIDEGEELSGVDPRSKGGSPQEDKPAPLSEVIQSFNERYGTNFTDEDRIIEMVENRLLSDETLIEGAQVNSKENFRIQFEDIFKKELFAVEDISTSFFEVLLERSEVREAIKELLFERVYEELGA
jgi:type I restriction enzyme R subunit